MKFAIIFMLFIAKGALAADSSSPIECRAAPIISGEQAICWAKYHISEAWPFFNFSEVTAETKLEENGVWSVWFLPVETGVRGGGATVALSRETAEMLELWAGR